MPTYKNNGSVPKALGEFGTVQAGKSKAVPRYVYPMPPNFAITSHQPYANHPWPIYVGSVPSYTISGLEKYLTLVFYNGTGDEVTVVWNGHIAAAQVFPDGALFELELEDNYSTVSVTGSGAGDVSIHGIPKRK